MNFTKICILAVVCGLIYNNLIYSKISPYTILCTLGAFAVLLNINSIKSETFSEDISIKKGPAAASILDEPLFKDAVQYDNDEKQLGIEKCFNKCNGACVEYGMTGIGRCFPKTN
jgi:hypothetical protein